MNMLLYPQLAPITFNFGLLKCTFPIVQGAFLQWTKDTHKNVQSREIDLPLDLALKELESFTASPRRWLLVPTSGEWVAYFNNFTRGSDPIAFVGHLSQQLSCWGVIATCIPHTLDEEVGQKIGSYGAVQFQLFAPYKTDFLNVERTVSLAYDTGRWRFDANGRIQEFEDIANYSNHRVVDRFTIKMLVQYCQALGIKLDSPEFYKKRSLLVWSDDVLPPQSSVLSLYQVRKAMGLESSEATR